VNSAIDAMTVAGEMWRRTKPGRFTQRSNPWGAQEYRSDSVRVRGR
jgi:hypothetical protein